MDKFFGGSPLYVLLRLALISLVLGVAMAAFNLDAFALVRKLKELIHYVYSLGFDAFAWVGEYFLLGAVIVFPVWLLLRLFALGKEKTNKD